MDKQMLKEEYIYAWEELKKARLNVQIAQKQNDNLLQYFTV